ncbi:hypothetical protein ACLKMH_22500 [Psychromonas sp. KJ10-10]|uniref:hypothetical protein n=1 Tax=Psychromonas sp. KJ10-10 TaxID=3391823 RepID=UPI0039B3FE99
MLGLKSLFTRFAKKIPTDLEAPITSESWAYRRSARFGLQFNRKTKKVNMGFRRALSNDLIDQQVCPVLKTSLEKLIEPLKLLLNSLQSKADLGHIELIESDQGPVVLLRHLSVLPKSDLQLIKVFCEQYQVNFLANLPKRVYLFKWSTKAFLSVTRVAMHA